MDGSAMFGPYRLDSLLGRGGMGEVHLAFDTEHHRTVALKTLVPHLADDEEFQSRFRREARHVAKLRNPHVIPIHRFGEIDGQLFIDMRYVEGPDLGELIRRSGPVPPRSAITFVEQIASALDAAHGNGLVHRDVKPSNVLVDSTVADFVYLVDFGITRSATTQRSYSLTRTGALLGSLDYMAPEQFDGVVSRQSDVYGLTCILYELLTATKPYSGEGLAALMRSHLSSPPPAPSDRDETLRAFDDVIATGMAKGSEQRYPSAGELGAAARAALGASPGRAPGLDAVRAGAVVPTGVDDEPMNLVGDHATIDQMDPESSTVRTHREPGPASDPLPGPERGDPPTEPIMIRPRPAVVARRGAVPPSRLLAGGPAGRRSPYPPQRAGRAEPMIGMPRLGPPRPTRAALVLGALALVAATTAGVLAATSERSPSPPVPQPSVQAAPTQNPPTQNPPTEVGPPVDAVRQVTFTGRTSAGAAITIAVGDRAAMAYLCDGSDVEAWLRGELRSGLNQTLRNATTGSELRAQVDPTEAIGQVVVGGTVHTFTATAGGADVGLYEATTESDGEQYRIGWVVLGDGDQEGIMTRGEEILPAPALDVASLTTIVDGRALSVTRHQGDGAFLGG